VNRLEAMAADGNPAVQMALPMAEILGSLHEGVGELRRMLRSGRLPGRERRHGPAQRCIETRYAAAESTIGEPVAPGAPPCQII
jgi:hypothetical protein